MKTCVNKTSGSAISLNDLPRLKYRLQAAGLTPRGSVKSIETDTPLGNANNHFQHDRD